jgi:DNA polymerase-3 subunit alpha
MTGFAHLHVHSYFSLLDGTVSPQALVERAKQLDMRYLALTDRNSLAGAVEFYKHAQNKGIHPIIGAEIDFNDMGPMVFLAMDADGYSNLSNLITVGNLRGGHLQFDLNLNDIFSRKRGLIAICGGQRSHLWQHIRKRDLKAAQQHTRKLKGVFGNQLYIAVQHFDESDRLYNLRLRDLAITMQVPLVATNDVFLCHAGDWETRRALRAIAQNTLIDRATGVGTPEQYLKSGKDILALLSYLPAAISNTIAIAKKCTFCFRLGKPVFPKVNLPQGYTSRSYLRKLAFAGARMRYKKFPAILPGRIRHELKIITEMGFPDYFIIVKEIVDFCHANAIPCVGRGSAGDSLVSYLLGITQVDPIRHNLYFERFLSRERKDPPDIDLDICWINRDRVLAFVYDRFGKDKTAMIATVSTFQLRSSIRDVAKVYGFPEDEIQTMLRFLPRFGIRELARAVEDIPHCRQLRANIGVLQTVLRTAEQISDFPRHFSIHAGGLVIAPKELSGYTPLQEAGKGLITTQMDMYSIEPMGLVKMDLLGVRALSVVTETVYHLENTHLGRAQTSPRQQNERRAIEYSQSRPAQMGIFASNLAPKPAPTVPPDRFVYRLDLRKKGIVAEDSSTYLEARRFPFLNRIDHQFALLDTRSIPTNDLAVSRMLRSGIALGCFQLESPAMRNLLSKMQVAGVDDVIAAVALIRPGAADSGMKDLYIQRRAGMVPVEYVTPALAPLLKETYGIIIYQEQVMQIASAIANFTLAQGEVLRRAMTKAKKREQILKLRRHFVEGVIGNGFSEEVAETVWGFLKNFVGYGFNKAHAAIYGVIAYQSAYLKYYFTVPFMTSVLNNEGGFYHTAAYIEEARRLGIRILPPDVNHSDKIFTWREDTIRVGLNRVFELTWSTLDKIIRERQRTGKYTDIYDFITRVRPRQGELENLIKCGALSTLNASEPELLLQSHLFYRNKFRQRSTARVPDKSVLQPYAPELRLQNEIKLLSLAVTDHPLRIFEYKIDYAKLVPSYKLMTYNGKTATIVGWRIASRRLRTRNEQYMQFLTLEDRYGLMEAVMFPDVFKRYGGQLVGAGPFLARGTVQSRLPGEANFIISYLESLA